MTDLRLPDAVALITVEELAAEVVIANEAVEVALETAKAATTKAVVLGTVSVLLANYWPPDGTLAQALELAPGEVSNAVAILLVALDGWGTITDRPEGV